MKKIAYLFRPDNKSWILYTLIAFGILSRVVLCTVINEPKIYTDSLEYIEFAEQIKCLNFDEYIGFRTPLYPLLLLMCLLNFDVVCLVQHILGIVISVLMFNIALRRTKSSILALCVGVFTSVSFYKLYYERIIMTETLVAFLLAFSVYLLYGMLIHQRTQPSRLLSLGLLSSLVGLTKPAMLFLAPVYAIILFVMDRKEALAVRAKRSLIILFPFFILVFGWSLFNKWTLNYFGPSTLAGYNLSNHSGGFIEHAPDSYAEIRDIYLKYRNNIVDQYGSHVMTVLTAAPEIMDATGLNQAELSKELTAMSIRLFIEHPILYGKSVFKAFSGFWSVKKGPNWEPVKMRFPLFSGIVEVLGMFINISFFVLAGLTTLWFFKSEDKGKLSFELVVIVIIFAGALLQAVVELGENRRYAIPFHPLIWYVFFVSGWSALSSVLRGRNPVLGSYEGGQKKGE